MEKSYNNRSFFSEIQRTIEMGKATDYNYYGCFDGVKEIVEGHGERLVIPLIVFPLIFKKGVVDICRGGLELYIKNVRRIFKLFMKRRWKILI